MIDGSGAAADALRDDVVVTTGHTAPVSCVSWSPDASLLATASRDGSARIFNAANGYELIRVVDTGHTDWVNSCAFNPAATSQTLVTGSKDRTCRVIEALTGNVMRTIHTGHTEPVIAVAYNPAGTQIATGSDDKTGA